MPPMGVAGSIWLTAFGLLIVAAVLAGGIFICRFIYALLYDAAVKKFLFTTVPNKALEKEFKRKFWSGVTLTVIALAIIALLIAD